MVGPDKCQRRGRLGRRTPHSDSEEQPKCAPLLPQRGQSCLRLTRQGSRHRFSGEGEAQNGNSGLNRFRPHIGSIPTSLPRRRIRQAAVDGDRRAGGGHLAGWRKREPGHSSIFPTLAPHYSPALRATSGRSQGWGTRAHYFHLRLVPGMNGRTRTQGLEKRISLPRWRREKP